MDDQTGERVVVADLVQKVLFLVGERILGEDTRPVVHMPDEELLVLADPHRVTQALVNLLVNAREAAGSTGRVALAVHEVTRDGCDFVRFTISDDGPGIDPEVLEGVYEPFFTTKATGTGLGLAIVKRVVEAHGGRIAMTPGEDGGTVVELDLPAAT
jgi:signal transduction histidine kinase